MIEKKDISKLNEYGTHICSKIKNNINRNISELINSTSMLDDIQNIINELINYISEQQKIIDNLKNESEQKITYISSIEGEIEKLRDKEKKYSEIEVNALQIAVTLNRINEKEKLLDEKVEKFKCDKEQFELEKKEINREKYEIGEAKEKADKEKREAIITRDKAIKEKRDLELQCEKLNEGINMYAKKSEKIYKICIEHESSIKDLKEDIDWYKKYAMAVDQKIIDFFKKINKDNLKNHFDNYLNNDNKLEEIREHFPEFKKNKEMKLEKDISENKTLKRKEDNKYREVEKP